MKSSLEQEFAKILLKNRSAEKINKLFDLISLPKQERVILEEIYVNKKEQKVLAYKYGRDERTIGRWHKNALKVSFVCLMCWIISKL